MKLFKKRKEKGELDNAIETRTCDVAVPSDSVEEDAAKIKNLKDLVEIKEKLEGPKFRINPNVCISGAVTVLGLAFVVIYDHVEVISSKVMSWVPKPKL